MYFSHIRLVNWRNFQAADVELQRRVFLIGANASGKSNFLDAFRFLHDIAAPQGGLRNAVERPSRRSIKQLRSLYARQNPDITIDVSVSGGDGPWRYQLRLKEDSKRQPIVHSELVEHAGQTLLDRPTEDDLADPNRLTQTHLEQVNANREFRPLAEFFGAIRYLHIVPHLVRDPQRGVPQPDDPYGSDFIEQMARVHHNTRKARLNRIAQALRVAVPQLKELELYEERGIHHLRGRYEHWRPHGAWQTEEQFSDGTLRLIGLLWAALDGDEPVLLEEPELSLHPGVVRQIVPMMARLSKRNHRQVLISTHSEDLLGDRGIGAGEVLLLKPGQEGTEVALGADDREIRALLEAGLTAGEAILPRVAPRDAMQLSLFGD